MVPLHLVQVPHGVAHLRGGLHHLRPQGQAMKDLVYETTLVFFICIYIVDLFDVEKRDNNFFLLLSIDYYNVYCFFLANSRKIYKVIGQYIKKEGQ